jgi:hypothetical protein
LVRGSRQRRKDSPQRCLAHIARDTQLYAYRQLDLVGILAIASTDKQNGRSGEGTAVLFSRVMLVAGTRNQDSCDWSNTKSQSWLLDGEVPTTVCVLLMSFQVLLVKRLDDAPLSWR